MLGTNNLAYWAHSCYEDYEVLWIRPLQLVILSILLLQ